jgi:hypothetical protein
VLEKRWLLGLGPPIIVMSAVAFATAPGALTRAASDVATAPLATRGTLERLAPDVAARAWIAERGDGAWVYGRAGGGILGTLPSGETAVAIGRRYLASTTTLPTGKSHVILREWGTGAIALEIDAPIWVSTGAFRADDLVVTGYGDGRAATDGGLAVLRAPAARWQVLVPAGPFSAGLATGSRGDVFTSPDGRLGASYLCAGELCHTHVVDLETGQLLHDGRHPAFLRAVTNDAMILTDGEFGWISAVDVRNGREIWRRPDSILMNPLAGEDGSVTGLIGSDGPGWAVARIEPDGQSTDLTPRTRSGAWPQVWTQLSTPRTAVIGHGDFVRALSGDIGPGADIVDTVHGQVIGRDVLLLPGNQGGGR